MTILTIADLRNTDRMDRERERIEALIADFESYVGDYPGQRIDWTVEIEPMHALIAAWRAERETKRDVSEVAAHLAQVKRRLEDENRRLRELLNLAINHVPLSQLTLRGNIDAALTMLPGGGPSPASGEAKDRAQDAMRAQVYPDLWPGPSLGPSPPPSPTQGEEEKLREKIAVLEAELRCAYNMPAALEKFDETREAALRQRADEATRNENIGCAALVERLLQRTYPMDSAYEPIVAAIRARIAPKGEP